MKNEIPNAHAVIFDLDGTLIDSVPAYFKMMAEILEIVGLPPAPRNVVAEFMAGGGMDAMEKIIPEELQHRKSELIRKCMMVGRKISQNIFKDQVKVFDGVPQLFLLLVEMKIPMGIVTSTEKSNIDRKLMPLEQSGIKKYLDAVIAIEDAPEKKPAPAPLLTCCDRLGVNAEKCIYVGDSQVDIRAANAAKMMGIGVLSGLDDHETLMAENPAMILQSVSDLKAFFR